MALIQAKNLNKTYKLKNRITNAVKDTSIEVNEGELIAITGKSGSGKSTFINILSGLLTPDNGEVIINGKNVYTLNDNERTRLRNEQIGIIPQGDSLLGTLTVLQNILLPATLYSDKENIDKVVQRARQLLIKFGIENLENEYPSNLSGGEIRRVMITRALINNPKVIFADEPTANLDDENTEIVINLLRDITKENVSVIYVTHEVDTTKAADKVYHMNQGSIT